MNRRWSLLLAGLIAATVLVFWRMPADITPLQQPQPAEAKTKSARAPSPESSLPQQSAVQGKNTPICQQVLPDHDWHKTPQREAIRQYLFDRLQQGDSPEQLLLMLRDHPAADSPLSQRQAELQYELFDALSRYEGSLIKDVFRQKAYSDFFDRLKRLPPAEKLAVLRSAPEIELTYLEPSGRLHNFQPKTIMLAMALHQQQFDKAIVGLHFYPGITVICFPAH